MYLVELLVYGKGKSIYFMVTLLKLKTSGRKVKQRRKKNYSTRAGECAQAKHTRSFEPHIKSAPNYILYT